MACMCKVEYTPRRSHLLFLDAPWPTVFRLVPSGSSGGRKNHACPDNQPRVPKSSLRSLSKSRDDELALAQPQLGRLPATIKGEYGKFDSSQTERTVALPNTTTITSAYYTQSWHPQHRSWKPLTNGPTTKIGLTSQAVKQQPPSALEPNTGARASAAVNFKPHACNHSKRNILRHGEL